jgi:hypothetical protein
MQSLSKLGRLALPCLVRIWAAILGVITYMISWRRLVIAVLIFAIVAKIEQMGSVEANPVQTGNLSKHTQPVTIAAPKELGSQWEYYQKADPMGRGTLYTAWVESANTVEFKFPYSGEQHGTLMLRTHPRLGKDVIFYIKKGQILCDSYEGCTVLVRFDDESPSKYHADSSNDHSTTTIFIKNYEKFIKKLQNAKRIRIEAGIYQQGSPVFEFDVTGFDQSQYQPRSNP